MRKQKSVVLICSVFDIATSSYYDYRECSQVIDAKIITAASQTVGAFLFDSWFNGTTGSRTLVIMMRDLWVTGLAVSKSACLMQNVMLVSAESKVHVYKQSEIERPTHQPSPIGYLISMQNW